MMNCIGVMMLFVMTLLTSCVGDGSQSLLLSHNHLSVIMISPGNNATNISTSPDIEIQFSESVSNVSESTLTLHEGSPTGSLVSIGDITAGNSNTYTFSPNTPLAEQTRYYVVLDSEITDHTGNLLESTTFSFTTGGFTAPTVNILSPSNNATNISTSPDIEIQFSESVSNVSESTLTLHEGSPTGSLVSVGDITAGDSNTYTFSPNTPLAEQTKYYIVLDNGITDHAGNLLESTTFSFTIGDFTAPTVNILSPSNNATNISTSPDVEIQFSESVSNVSESTLTLHEGGPTGSLVSIGDITAGDSNTYTFSPNTPLAELTRYYIVLGNGITDHTGNLLESTIFSFTTGDFTAPTVNILLPSNNATNRSIIPSIEIQFSESVSNVSESTLTLHEGSPTGSLVSIGDITAGDSNTYTFSPNTLLAEQTTYYVVLDSGITDHVGDMLEPTTFSFTTVAIGVTACNTASPFRCYRSVAGESWSMIAGNTDGYLQSGGVVVDVSGVITACNSASPFRCYRSLHGESWIAIVGNTDSELLPGGIVVDESGVVTACNTASPFRCYRSLHGESWSAIAGNTESYLQFGGIVVDKSGVVTACNRASPFRCYRSVAGESWSVIAGNTDSELLSGGIVVDESGVVTACNTASPFRCYRSVAGEIRSVVSPNFNYYLQYSGITVDRSGVVTVCRFTAPFRCYRLLNSDAWGAVSGSVDENYLQSGGIVVDESGDVTACNESDPFECYRSVAGGSWSAIAGNTESELQFGGIVVDGAGVATACNNTAPFKCYRSVAGESWSPIPGVTAGNLQDTGLQSYYHSNKGR